MFVLTVAKYAILATVFTIRASEIQDDDPCIITSFEQVPNITTTCKNIILDNVLVPGGQQMLINLTEGSTLTFRGNTSFNYYEWDGPSVLIFGNDITVRGEKDSILDGQGPLWWDGQGTWGNITKPRLLRIINTTNAVLDGINIRDCPLSCTSIINSINVTLRNFRIDNLDGDEGVAPNNKFGHNTDGFQVHTSRNILIEDSFVYNQDDCVVLNSGTNITVRNLFCHGSHGLSVAAEAATIEDVLIENSIVIMAENGIHVKAPIDVGEGLVRNILYRNITLLDSKLYGINVQQNYQNLPAGQPQDAPPKNNVPIYNLTMINIFGNVLEGAVPIFVLCAEEGCFDWEWEGVTIYGARSDNCTNYKPDGYDC